MVCAAQAMIWAQRPNLYATPNSLNPPPPKIHLKCNLGQLPPGPRIAVSNHLKSAGRIQMHPPRGKHLGKIPWIASDRIGKNTLCSNACGKLKGYCGSPLDAKEQKWNKEHVEALGTTLQALGTEQCGDTHSYPQACPPVVNPCHTHAMPQVLACRRASFDVRPTLICRR